MNILISNETPLIFSPGRVPYWLVVKRYWRALIGTCGAWYQLNPE